MGIGRDSTAPEANPKRATIASVSWFFTQSLFDSDCSLYDPNPSTDVTSPLHSPRPIFGEEKAHACEIAWLRQPAPNYKSKRPHPHVLPTIRTEGVTR